MKRFRKIMFLGLGTVLLAQACKKDDYTAATIAADASLALKDASSYDVGVAVSYDSIANNSNFAAIVKQQFDIITPGYEMKHGAIVKNDGTYDFTKADYLVNFAMSNGLAVYGHTLVWHQNNNGNYLRALIAKPSSTPASNPNLLPNESFENGTAGTVSNTGSTYGSIATNWTAQVQGTSVGSVSLTTATGETYHGARALKAVVTTVPANSYQYQVFPDGTGIPTLKAGVSYKISFYAKHIGATTPKIRLQTQAGGYQTSDVTVTTTWAKYSASLTPSTDATRFNFQFINTGTFLIDSVTVTLTTPVAGAASAAELKLRVDTTMKNWITTMVTRYKDRVHAWDVVNEVLDDSGVLRTGESASDTFYWGSYLGDSLCIKAFKYAHDADPTAKLFLNDYNQELGGAKLDSLIALVTRLKNKGVPIDGVGLQMHINYNLSNANIDNAIMKMARLGLLVKITELDISVNTGSQTDPATKNFVLTPTLLAQQAAKYKYVVESYYRNVPEAQRFGITVWGVSDKDSWLRNRLPYHTVDYPLLWDESFNKKPAYTSFQEALQLK